MTKNACAIVQATVKVSGENLQIKKRAYAGPISRSASHGSLSVTSMNNTYHVRVSLDVHSISSSGWKVLMLLDSDRFPIQGCLSSGEVCSDTPELRFPSSSAILPPRSFKSLDRLSSHRLLACTLASSSSPANCCARSACRTAQARIHSGARRVTAKTMADCL